MVSIIIPVYNVQAYLRECLDSVLAQTYTDIEVILVDDGSTDKSGIICDEYREKDRRVRVCHKQNAGVSAARNTGIELAGGEYLVFVDSDDCIHPELVKMYMQTMKPDTTVLCEYTTDLEIWKNFKADDAMNCVEMVIKEQFMKLFFRDYMNPPFNKCFRTEVIKEHGICFPEDLNLGEDLLFNLKYLTAIDGSYQILHGPFYYYRENRAGSLSNSARTDLLDIQKILFASVRDFMTGNNIWTEENASIYYSMYWDRLYLTWKISGKLTPGILKDKIWNEVWSECKKRNLVTWKRRVKKLELDIRRTLL